MLEKKVDLESVLTFERTFRFAKGEEFQGKPLPEAWIIKTKFCFPQNVINFTKKNEIDLKKLAFDPAWKHHLIEDNLVTPELEPEIGVKEVKVNFVEIRKAGLRDSFPFTMTGGFFRIITSFFHDEKAEKEATEKGIENIDFGCVLPGYVIKYYLLPDKKVLHEANVHFR